MAARDIRPTARPQRHRAELRQVPILDATTGQAAGATKIVSITVQLTIRCVRSWRTLEKYPRSIFSDQARTATAAKYQAIGFRFHANAAGPGTKVPSRRAFHAKPPPGPRSRQAARSWRAATHQLANQ